MYRVKFKKYTIKNVTIFRPLQIGHGDPLDLVFTVPALIYIKVTQKLNGDFLSSNLWTQLSQRTPSCLDSTFSLTKTKTSVPVYQRPGVPLAGDDLTVPELHQSHV